MNKSGCLGLPAVSHPESVNPAPFYFGLEWTNFHICTNVVNDLNQPYELQKDILTSFLTCFAPIFCMAPAVPEYGKRPPSSWSDPTVTSTSFSTLAASTGEIQHSLQLNGYSENNRSANTETAKQVQR